MSDLPLDLILPSHLQVRTAMERLQEIAAEVHACTMAGSGKGVDAQGSAPETLDATPAAEGKLSKGLCPQSVNTPLRHKCTRSTSTVWIL